MWLNLIHSSSMPDSTRKAFDKLTESAELVALVIWGSMETDLWVDSMRRGYL